MTSNTKISTAQICNIRSYEECRCNVHAILYRTQKILVPVSRNNECLVSVVDVMSKFKACYRNLLCLGALYLAGTMHLSFS